MSDVLARLMQWMETSDIDDADAVLRDAITEIAGLRARLDELRLARPTLTDEERAAVEVMERVANRTETLVVGIGPRHAKRLHGPTIAATLLGLLKRLG
jgi:predicted flap endonuclease-1-like 5' DNA nuclease